MSTWMHVAVKADEDDEDDEEAQQGWPEGFLLGPIVCYNSGSELALVMRRYEYRKITEESAERAEELAGFLDYEKSEWREEEEGPLAERLRDWLSEHIGKTLYLKCE